MTQIQAAWLIEQQIRRFAALNDAHDHEGLAALFTADGSFARPTDPDNPVIDREAIRSFFASRPKRVTRHVMTNSIIDLLDSERARVHSYVTLHVADGMMVGDFYDEMICQNGIWLFQARRGTLAF